MAEDNNTERNYQGSNNTSQPPPAPGSSGGNEPSGSPQRQNPSQSTPEGRLPNSGANSHSNHSLNNPRQHHPNGVNGLNGRLANGRANDDPMYQYQLRGLLVLLIAVVIGYLYLHIASPPISRHKLVPNEYGSLGKSPSLQSPKSIRSPSSNPPDVSTSHPEEEAHEGSLMRYDIHGKPFIDPKFEEHSKYLAHVLHTIGDLSRRMEIGENITKPIGGIVEMRAELLGEEEEADLEDVPDYMKQLGTIIDDLQRSKTKGKIEKFKPSIRKNPFTDPQKLEERKQKRQRWKEEFEAEERELWNTPSSNLDDPNIVVGENEDEVVSDEFNDDDPQDDHIPLKNFNMKEFQENLDNFWKKYEIDPADPDDFDEIDDEDDDDDDDDDSVGGKKSGESVGKLLARANKLRMGIEMLRLMFEMEEKEEKEAKEKERREKGNFQNEGTFAL